MMSSSTSGRIPRLVVGGVSSGVGKTTVTVALARALRARGLRVALFKCGPDYLDPSYHARAVGQPAQNLDGWMMGRDAVRATFAAGVDDADVALIEGVMGLFDGASVTGEEGSTAEIAKWLDAPVVLVFDAGGMARSAAALVDGFARFDPALPVAGAIANRVGSRGHVELLDQALRGVRLFGALPRDPAGVFPGRHLGLRTADEDAVPESTFVRWGEVATSWLALDGLLRAAAAAPPLSRAEPEAAAPLVAGPPAGDDDRGAIAAPLPPRQPQEPPARPLPTARAPRPVRLGLAFDEAFHFYYQDNLRRLEAAGAELVRFSPLRDAAVPAVDGLYLGGGYPELHGAALAGNLVMRESIAALGRRGAPVYAECGGLMYLTRAIVTVERVRHDMVGLLPGVAHMHEELQALGYVEIETQADTLLGGKATRFRGHQFRYSRLELDDAVGVDASDLVYALRRRRGGDTHREGYRVGNVLASYVHAHWASNPTVATSLVAACRRFAERAERAEGVR
jgi:cobyrinic acid a,c-diamide synthase